MIETPHGPVFHDQLHGTAFFISEAGFFLTAAHVVEPFPNEAPPLRVVILGGYGVTIMHVAFVTRHPTYDVALGLAVVEKSQPAKPSPMTLSTRTLDAGSHVAILGYPQTRTAHKLSEAGEALSKFTFTPDFYEGDVLEHHPEGVSLARWPAYSTDIVPPAPLKDFSGISGGPLVAADSVHVHGIVCSASESYAICTDIETVLDWDVFEHDVAGTVTIRQFGQRYPGVIRIAT